MESATKTNSDILTMTTEDRMTFSIKYFGSVAEATGHSSEPWTANGPTDTQMLREHLAAKYPQIKGIRFRIAVNQEICETDTLLTHEDEVALLPAFSGG